jgi:hypothetical protein
MTEPTRAPIAAVTPIATTPQKTTRATAGLLPLGVGTGPAAMVTALGTTSLVTATAAGMVVSAATVLAVLIYAGAVWAWHTAARRVALPVPLIEG